MLHCTSGWSLRWFHHRLVGIVGTLCEWRDLSTLSKGAHEMTITILAVVGYMAHLKETIQEVNRLSKEGLAGC